MEEMNLIRHKMDKERDIEYYTTKIVEVDKAMQECPPNEKNYYKRMLKHFTKKKVKSEKELDKLGTLW